MANPFEQLPVLQKPQKLDVCEHGNPKGLCEVCSGQSSSNDEKKESHENWKTIRGMTAELGLGENRKKVLTLVKKYEKTNPEWIKNLWNGKARQNLVHYSPELFEVIKQDLANRENASDEWESRYDLFHRLDCTYDAVEKIVEPYRETNPEWIKKLDTQKVGRHAEHYAKELVQIIEAKILGEKKEKINYENPEHLKKIIEDPKNPIDLKNCKTSEFAKNYFGKNTEFGDFQGQWILKKFGLKKVSTENLNKLLNFAGFESEYVKVEEIDYNNPAHLKEMLEKPKEPIDLNTCGQREFTKVFFGVNSRFGEKNGDTLLRNFGTKKRDTENMIAFLNFAGFKREYTRVEKIDYNNPAHLKEMLEKPKEPIDLKTCESVDFNEMTFGTESRFGGKNGRALLWNFGTKKRDTENMIAFLNFAGVEREQFDYNNIIHLKEMLEKPKEAIDLNECGIVEFLKTNFGVGSRFGEKDGYKLLRNFGTKEVDKVNMVALLRFAGFNRDRRNDIDYNNPAHLKEMLEKPKEPIDLKTCEFAEFKMVTFGIGSHFGGRSAQTLLRNFGTKKIDSENMIALLNFAGIDRKNETLEKRNEDNLKQSLEKLVQEISNSETKDERARKIREIMELLPENACDILLKYHPEYSGLKNEYVKSVIADYLGDFLLVRRAWEPKDIEMTKELFSEERFAEALFIKFKEASFAYYQSEKRNNSKENDQELIMRYFEQAELVQAAARIPEVQKTIKRLKEYYDDLFKWASKKPDGIVDSLKEGRVFPDINQLVNIKEIADNGKMLIADEMGLGKSASVILAKEYLGLKCAVIVMPSNVEDTWKNYLSDNMDKDGKQKGYFKKDAVPRVLIIEDKNDLRRLKAEVFDYILISQEKMSKEHYLEALESVDFDMLIIDEVHKLKNIEEGIRSENAIKLAEKIQGDNKYLAMLSGTPMPNKVKDLAIVLKLLYPEKYKDKSDKDLINHIIYDDMAGLRQELFARMQMKEVATSIEIPPLIEEPDVEVELSPEEKEVYQILLEEDELTASQKIIIFRQFLLNPQLLGMEPGFEGSKVKKLKETLAEDMKTKSRIIVWVNSYIDGVIRPEKDEQGKVIVASMIDKLELPKEMVWTIHGEDKNKKKYREGVQELFNNGGSEKIVLFVSGQAADVGVDFSGADEIIHYNEPWSKYDKRQQEKRSHREGLKQPLVVKTLITRGTIEDGIHRYINTKEKAIEKLLRGLDRTEEENKMLKKDANSRKKEVEADNDLSDDIRSDWERMMIHFGAGWEAGEEYFKNMPEEEKESYARLYRQYTRLSYQGNNVRASVSLLEKMIAEQNKSGERLRILDIASGPEMLKRCVRGDLRNQIYSMDINERHFDEATDSRRTFKKSYLSLPVRSNSADYYNIGFAFHQTKELKFYKKNYEKLQVMAEMNRVLKIGGRAVISEIHNAQFENPEKLEEILGRIGMRIVKGYSGDADGGENYRSHFLTLEKVGEIDGYGSDTFRLNEAEKKQRIRELGDKLGKELLAGLEIKKLPKGASRLADQRRMIDGFRLGGQEFKIIFTEEDRRLFNEEKKSIKDGEALKKKFGGRVDDIPLAELHSIGFKRKLRNPNLMYKIVENGGVIVVRGDKK